jgi:hypothetical protein
MTSATELYGTWRLVSWTVEVIETGEAIHPFGKDPSGYIHLTPEGRLFAVLTASGRKPVETEADQIAAFGSLVAYAGRYRLEGNKMVTTVDVSADPAMVGTDLVRFITLDGSDLEITTAPFISDKPSLGLGTRQLRSCLAWRRENPSD